MPVRRTFALLSALLLMAGCSYQVNMAAQRQSYDAYLDLGPRLRAQAMSKRSYLNEMLAQTSNKSQSPYPELNAELASMDRAAQDVIGQQSAVKSFEKSFDAFAAQHPSVASDDKVLWPQFQEVQAQFQPTGSRIESSRQSFNSANAQFDALCKKYGIQKTNVADLKKQMAAFGDDINASLPEMADRVEGDSKALRFAANSGADPELIKGKRELLKRMDDMLPGMRLLQQATNVSLKTLAGSLPEKGVIWTGPGMAGNIDALNSLWDAQDQFNKNRNEFNRLSGQFDKVSKPADKAGQAPNKAPGY